MQILVFSLSVLIGGFLILLIFSALIVSLIIIFKSNSFVTFTTFLVMVIPILSIIAQIQFNGYLFTNDAMKYQYRVLTQNKKGELTKTHSIYNLYKGDRNPEIKHN
jgi:hypothetical protein